MARWSEVAEMFKITFKILKPMGKIVHYLNKQQAKGVELSPRMRNALAMINLLQNKSPKTDPKELLSFEDAGWFYLDLLAELEANPDLLPDSYAETLNSYTFYVRRLEDLCARDFERRRPKWEKKNHREYQPKPRPNLIGEPLE